MTINKPQTASLIDTLSEGYATINRRPWLVIVPILLNLYLWFGTQVSLGPFARDLQGLLERMPPPAAAGSTQPQPIDLSGLGEIDIRQQIAMFNYIPLTIYVVDALDKSRGALGLPMIQPVQQMLDARRADTIQLGSAASVLVAFALLNALLLPLSVAFLSKVAEAVRGDRATLGGWLRRAARATLALIGCIGILIGVGLALGLPIFFFSLALLWLSPALGTFVLVIFWVLLFWARVYVGFARESILMHDYGPLRAIYISFNLVRRNFWSTLGFLIICAVIALGSGVIWQMLSGSTVGLIAAIVGSAYVGSGLIAARMAFYRERMQRWRSSGAPARAQ